MRIGTYTDQELDAETGLYNYNARLYDPGIGMFICADPIVPGGGYDPQMLNRYSYVRNNPLIYVDPSGYHYGTDSPGGKADFGGETVSGESIDNSDGRGDFGPFGDAGWGDYFNRSKSYSADPEGTAERAEAFRIESDRRVYFALVSEYASFWDKCEFAVLYLSGYYGFKAIPAAYRAYRISKALDSLDVSNGVDKLFKAGRTPTASELKKFAEQQGWKPSQTENGPLKYFDENGVNRLTIKQGSSRAPGSANAHVELRNASGQRVDPTGNPVTRRSPDNHSPIDFDL